MKLIKKIMILFVTKTCELNVLANSQKHAKKAAQKW